MVIVKLPYIDWERKTKLTSPQNLKQPTKLDLIICDLCTIDGVGSLIVPDFTISM